MADSSAVSVLSFSRSLYDKEAIDAAAEAFKALATFQVSAADDAITVSVSEIDARVADRLTDAFCNHALYETVARARAVEELS